MRRAARIDKNHDDIVQALRAVGATVQSLAAVGSGVPDLLVGFRKQTFLVEVKDGQAPPSAKKLNPAQVIWHHNWTGGPLAVVESVEDALKLIGVR
jgi:hypothetical protein